MSELQRTHTCGQLRKADAGSDITLSGWVDSRRDHGGVIFIDLRDRYGKTQIVFNPEHNAETHEAASVLRSEYVISVRGKVEERPDGMANPDLDTGDIDVMVDILEILNTSETTPFEITGDTEVSTELRLKYRYLDLRRPLMQKYLTARHKVYQVTRRYFDSNDFIEIETPFLTRSTPEGARDYLVPSRINRGQFYALPQSPQLFKQILMVSGFDRYFQIVKCFRDEDLRAQRQPEFTQVDLEMSFVREDDVINMIEGLMVEIFKEVLGKEISAPFPRLSYKDAMDLYGCDAPDLRFEMTIKEITDIAKKSDFKVFKSVAESGGQIRGINATGCAKLSRKDIDELTTFVNQFGAKGLAWFKVDENGLTSQIAKFFNAELQKEIIERFNAAPGDLLLFVADKKRVVSQALSQLRINIAKSNGLINKEEFNLSWVVEFPLFEYNEDAGRYDSLHHPFTSPHPDDLGHLEERPLDVRARAYDLVLNGVELGGGSIRIHRQDIQKKIFSLLNIDETTAQERFGFLLEALKYGAPPHGGIALGLDRMVTLLLGLDDIREVIAFPKTQKATCLMVDAPSDVDEKQLKDLGLSILKPD
ncbi:MAG: aspartate--tRNA ligase [Candidatus Scalindua rubra]|uniref:Aspartate--tRNA(Asp/Asn) ligase n=1 Tax=Candidatus Scalindua brodae TaxID=237368 RepID=A0A0B0ECD6_9BACT|nr:MAG: aspartyl-tRNA synthase [Candidatus Scalindua brodae]MBZ0110682.1 aspartate--tRNA ligase [Candidatus Scalindua rubra]